MGMRCLVKICGVTTVADAVAAAELGADAIGLNFYAKSPRCIDETTARAILDALPPHVKAIVLAVEEHWDETLARLERLSGVHALQIHHRTLTACPEPATLWIPAFAVKDESSIASIGGFLESCRAAGAMPEAFLVDAHVPGSFGGTGQALPWHLLREFDPGVPLILAGGLTPENVADAIRIVRPWGVDVAGGVESSPGKKDHGRIRAFVAAVRSAAREFAVPPVSG